MTLRRRVAERHFAFFLALDQNLCSFRVTRQAKGAGLEQTEVIMSDFELQEKAVRTAIRFIERKGFDLLETGWVPPREPPSTWSPTTRALSYSSTSPQPSTTKAASRAARFPASIWRSPRQLGLPATRPRMTFASSLTSSTCWS